MRRADKELEKNKLETTIFDFMASYNDTMPENFPRATIKKLEEFRLSHSNQFKNNSGWSIEKHRKHIMDWLLSH